MPFKIYRNMNVQAQWIKLRQFQVEVWDHWKMSIKHPDNKIMIVSSEAPGTNHRQLKIYNHNKHREFVIEALSADGRYVDCYYALRNMVV